MKKYELAKKLLKILILGLKIVRPSAGTSLPGRFMMKLCPNYISVQSQKVSDKKVFVTGTNGKTTSSGILASILEQTNKNVLHNKQGANMPQGIATCFLKNDEKAVFDGLIEDVFFKPLFDSPNEGQYNVLGDSYENYLQIEQIKQYQSILLN